MTGFLFFSLLIELFFVDLLSKIYVMIIEETKIVVDSKTETERVVSGYFLTINDLQKLVRDFQVDCFDGFVSNDQSYIEEWMKKKSKKICTE